MKIFKNDSLTLVEVLVSVTIFISVLAGILAVFVSANRLNASTRYRLEAVNLARSLLERLKAEVRQDTWDTGNLRIQPDYVQESYHNLNNLPLIQGAYISGDNKAYYTVDYRVTNDNGTTAYRRVDVRVTINPVAG